MSTTYVLQTADGQQYPVLSELRIGRDTSCQVILNNPLVSRNHAVLWVEDDGLFVRDENSRNGTFVNEQRLPAGRPIGLRPGDILRTGGTPFTVAVAAGPVAAPTPVAPADANVVSAPTVAFRAGSIEALAVQQAARIGASSAQGAAQGMPTFVLNGTFGLYQQDEECVFADAPYTSGQIEITANFASGQAWGSLSGAGSGTRTDLRCGADTGDMTWHHEYTASFRGTLDRSTGSLTLHGTLTGHNEVSFHNCQSQGRPAICPDGYSTSYSHPLTITGVVDPNRRTGRGTITVTEIRLPTAGDWSGRASDQ